MIKVFPSSYQWLIPLGLIGEGNSVSYAYRLYAFQQDNRKIIDSIVLMILMSF